MMATTRISEAPTLRKYTVNSYVHAFDCDEYIRPAIIRAVRVKADDNSATFVVSFIGTTRVVELCAKDFIEEDITALPNAKLKEGQTVWWMDPFGSRLEGRVRLHDRKTQIVQLTLVESNDVIECSAKDLRFHDGTIALISSPQSDKPDAHASDDKSKRQQPRASSTGRVEKIVNRKRNSSVLLMQSVEASPASVIASPVKRARKTLGSVRHAGFRCAWKDCNSVFSSTEEVRMHVREHFTAAASATAADHGVLATDEEEFYYTEEEAIEFHETDPSSIVYDSPYKRKMVAMTKKKDETVRRRRLDTVPSSPPIELRALQSSLGRSGSAEVCMLKQITENSPTTPANILGSMKTPSSSSRSLKSEPDTVSSLDTKTIGGKTRALEVVPKQKVKCRKLYSIEHKHLWCTQCRWKKACVRVPYSRRKSSNEMDDDDGDDDEIRRQKLQFLDEVHVVEDESFHS